MKRFAALVAVLALVAFAAPAFAANPFMDVPMNHWAYDAVSQLASRGVVSGYPDGAFKGEWKATRYEMASVVARALAYVDMNKASKQDLELLKKLVVEFKDELDALGVKVDELDARVADLEKGVGKWYFSGDFRFTAKWFDGFEDTTWTVDRFRWNIRKVVDDKVTMNVRLQGGGGADLAIVRAYATVKFPAIGVTMNVGRLPLDWEGDFYATDHPGFNMNDAYITDFDPLTTAFHFIKPFSMGSFELFVAHDEVQDFETVLMDSNWLPPLVPLYDEWTFASERYVYGARLAFNFSEMFSLAVNYVKYDYADNALYNVWAYDGSGSQWLNSNWFNTVYSLAADWSTLWGDLIVHFVPGVTFKGQYFMQDLDPAWTTVTGYADNSPNAWKAILDVDQDVLKFTSLWIEYAQIDQGFVFGPDPYGWARTSRFLGDYNQAIADTKVLNIVAKQNWNEKWATYVRYADFDVDLVNRDYYAWSASVLYHYTPNIFFELGFDKYGGDGAPADDQMIWFRTYVSF